MKILPVNRKARKATLFSALAGGAVVLAFALTPGSPTEAGNVVEMYQDPNCGCCTDWADHLRESGFEVNQHKTRDMRSIKIEHGVTPELSSCHTALIDGYVIEGHVPAADIKRLLEERPDVVGLTVPGMPHGSPGMETGRYDDYAVLTWQHEDRTPAIFSEYTH
ncbi:DUF411 domain-containing protein [Billgrantia kenyensis]|uniref:DUF411 domain-containing protein n=1 Tax=Billgrantia kenyensis TaxID=321266 RepID=A0A7V9W3T5_9GAMM|nr:DUF411 domain-containing protein [Halomonas kenyensis]MBA2780558.1 DUF411 domain-containing protein [Halomonas kenyensis]MCG6663251.1 DUF411 domain-containing protein [Halomonas kenyensis]